MRSWMAEKPGATLDFYPMLDIAKRLPQLKCRGSSLQPN